MAEIIKIDFDDGWRNIQIGDDESRIIRINPTDPGILKRIEMFPKMAEKIVKKYGDIDLSCVEKIEDLNPENPDFDMLLNAHKTISEIEKAVMELIDSLFESPVSSVVFKDSSCLRPINGEPAYIVFLSKITEYISGEISKNTAKKQAVISAYENKAKSFSKQHYHNKKINHKKGRK